MATLYWGGGAGTWDGFTTTNWYTDLARTTLSSRAPSAEDDVVFDSSSNATSYTVTRGNGLVCRNCTISGPATGTLTLSASSATWYIYGNLSLPATGLANLSTTTIQFWGSGSHTITTNGVTIANSVILNGSGTYTLQDALNMSTSQLQVNNGTFDTNGYNLTCGTISTSSTASPAALTLGASTVSATTFTPQSTLTLNAGTSNITLSNASANIGSTVSYTGNTFYNVTFSSNAVSTISIRGANTFNNLTFTTPAASRISNVVIYGNQTVNGTLTIAGADGAKRYFVQSDTVGTARTLTVATVGTLTDVDFRDITVAGASSPWSGTRIGDCKGNSNITFTAAANKYIAASTGSSNWSANIWATSSGGSASTANFPLAQDTVIIDNSGMNTSATLTLDIAYNIGALSAGGRTNAMTIAGSASITFYDDVTLSTNITSTYTGTGYYSKRGTQVLTSAGKDFGGIYILSPSGTLQLADNYTASTRTIILFAGTFDANNKNITCSKINSSGSLTKTLTLGSGTIATSSGISNEGSDVSNLTVTTTTATITCSGNSSIGFTGITATFNGDITVSGAGSGFTVEGTTTIANLTLTAPTTTGITSKLGLGGNLTVTGTLALAGGTSVTQRAFITSGTLGTQRTLSAATVTGLTDIDFRDINATGAADWTTGTRLGDCGGNAGITFPAAKTVYWNLAGTNNWSATGWATGSGGTPAANNFPLAQDTAVFDNTGSIGTVTIDAGWNIGTISAGGRTSAWTLAGSASPTIYGDVTYGSGITASNTGTYTFAGRGTQTFTTAGKSLTNAISINKPAGTFRHGDAYTSTGNITVTLGNYETQNYNISAASLGASNSNTRSITLGTSVLTFSSTDTIVFTTSTNLTFSGASSTINLSSTSAKTFFGGGQTFGTVSSTGGTTGALTITGSNKFGTLTNSAYTYLIFTSGTTQEVTTFSYTGASGNVVRWYTSVPGQRATIKTASNAVGTNSTDGGNNSGLSFTGTTNNYFYVKDIAYQSDVVSGGNFLFFFH